MSWDRVINWGGGDAFYGTDFDYKCYGYHVPQVNASPNVSGVQHFWKRVRNVDPEAVNRVGYS